MNPKTIMFWLLVVLSFLLPMPGAVAFANWDAPYGFYKDLATWLECSSSALLLVLGYGAYERKRGEISRGTLIAAVLLWIVTVGLGYLPQGPIRGEMGYGGGNVLSFLFGGLVGLLLSLMLFPMTLPDILAGGPYPYDRPLVIVWYVLLVMAVVLAVACIKKKRELKAQHSQAP
ncbi:hypothetical protein [Palaeococcus ferrophilus]|uniref:hypothetical protein n=1 Tax=Palaeococcus ferrophilus TaxID=83868 RepID=UPI00064F176F|nr:hypothetical protein [Palaeococcus ferrophilus]